MNKKNLVVDKYYPTIGIECHVQLKTRTKLFAGINNDARRASPNTLISPLCVGLPGTLPILNWEAVRLTIKAGLALRAEIAKVSHFDRKHYFYPDLPKGYQITQFERPIVGRGVVEVPMDDGSWLKVRITRAHLEEDAGKNTHPTGFNYSLVDLNRVGTPLLEIVSEADMHSAMEARAFAHELYLIMKYAGVSDVDLYHGNMRFDINVSVSDDPNKLGIRSETKNLNSFKSVEKAVDYEIKRQVEILEKGGIITQETRGWDEAKQKTVSQRGKEDAHDYRYMPDPDIPPITISTDLVAQIAKEMPLSPSILRDKFATFGLNNSQISTILDEPELASIIKYVTEAHDNKTAKTINNWCIGELQRLYISGELKWSQVAKNIDKLVELASMIDGKIISSSVAKSLLSEIVYKNANPQKLAEDKKLIQISDEKELVMIVEQVISEHPQAVKDIKSGEQKAVGFLIGQVMTASTGRANPSVVQKIIKHIIGVS